MKITQTRNYSLFISDETNRPITESHKNSLRKLTASMKKYGFLPFPILVRRVGQKLMVLDGMHRLHVATELKLPVYYVETERDDIRISETAEGQRPWMIGDYVGSFSAQGFKDYAELEAFAKEFDMPAARAATILSGNISSSTGFMGVLKSGRFVVKDREYASRIASIIAALSKLVAWASSSSSISAISRFVRVPEFDDSQLIKKAEAHFHLLVKQPTMEAYSSMYEQVYNYSSRKQIPLAFLAKQAAAKRNAANKRQHDGDEN
mgnify:CR=1 FL=1